MPSSSTNSYKSHRSTASSCSTNSHGSAHTQATNITSYSDARPAIKRCDKNPDGVYQLLEEPLTYDQEADPRSSVETYASTVASTEDLADQQEYELPTERYQCYEADATPSTPSDFAKLFPSTRRILIQHDDSISDGNMNLRLDTEFTTETGNRAKMTLFHLRMKNLHERQFSLRRYCRDSGREICSSKKKYMKPTPRPRHSKRPSLQRSLTSALQNMGLKSIRGHHREDSGYASDDDKDLDEDLKLLNIDPEVKATIPTNIIRMEFSNYAQVEVHRRRQEHIKQYDFEYWGEPYTWRREFSYDEGDAVYSYELLNLATSRCIAYIMPDKLGAEQAEQEEAQGGWVPPSSLRITAKSISEDLGDVIVATGLIALADDCIKRRWHNSHTARVHVPGVSAVDYVDPAKVVDEVFPRHGHTTARR